MNEHEGYMKEEVFVVVKAFNDWIELLKELGAKYKVVNESDYTGFQARVYYDEI